MQTLHEANELRAAVNREKQRGRSIALVPTMGNLHEGHLQLVKHAQQIADIVIVSIFVNPMQFAAHEDLDTYPRTPVEDCNALEALGTQYLFTPKVSTMYPAGLEDHTRVSIQMLGADLCGKTRPAFFEGVCTVVCKLFNLVQPNMAIFGEKDFQQLAIIRRMTADLCMPIEIIGVPTVREKSGLALSSRNNYLSDSERETAAELYRQLCSIRDAIESGNLNYSELIDHSRTALAKAGFEPDYLEVRNGETLARLDELTQLSRIVVLAAAKLGSTRLIDNIAFDYPQ